MLRIACIALSVLSAAACRSKPVYLNRDVRTVAVLPPFNHDLDIEASRKMRHHVEHAVGAHGYAVHSPAAVDDLYRRKNFTLPEEISQYRASEVAKDLGADAILTTDIERWGSRMELLGSSVGIEATFTLYDGKTDEVLWKAEGSGVEHRTVLDVESGIEAAAALVFENAEAYCSKCCNDGFRTLPLAGYDPEHKPAP